MNRQRARIVVRGAVQGVGFRPFVWRLARELRLDGWVLNSPQGVSIEIEGAAETVRLFRARLEGERPRAAILNALEFSLIDTISEPGFEIRDSTGGGEKTALVLPDLATCPDCQREIFDPVNRRYRYPFTNCTACGPRFSIIEALPYDRAQTTMRRFAMCAECEREYRDPANRRFHAQPNACPECGPRLELWEADGAVLGRDYFGLTEAVRALRQGKILALKGIGGFQLMVDARNEEAVGKLRERKRRMEKPFAAMFPDLESARECCFIGELEEELLLSAAAPIVLLEKRRDLLPVAPGNPNLGVMLPYSPLHHLLMRELDGPLVATSGNLSDEPICIDEREALQRLAGIADLFLVHNRPIARHVDDSIARVVLGREMLLRRARGYAPLPVSFHSEETVLAVGAHLKNAVALGIGGQAFISPHIGDLETEQAFAAFRQSAGDLPRLYDAQPAVVACDLHPEYLSTKFARQTGAEVIGVQHHYAHALSCLAENEVAGPALAVCWDGTGYGTDGTIWGGEFLMIDDAGFERVAHLRAFMLPGGEAAVRQPRRSALGLLYELFGSSLFERRDLLVLENFSALELKMVERMLRGGVNSPVTSSMGRLFDAVAALVGLRQRASFEGQAAMELEFAVAAGIDEGYSFEVHEQELDWKPVILELLEEIRSKPVGVVAAKFHNGLADAIVQIAQKTGEENVALTGGCFQNKYLLETAVTRLRAAGFVPYWHRLVPTNDGGIALGQLAAVARARARKICQQKESHVSGHSR